MFIKSRAVLAASSLALACAVAPPAYTQSLQEDAAAFGARQSILDISLSPDGDKIAYVAPLNGSGEALYVVDLAGDATPRLSLTNSNVMTDLAGCRWASNERIICNTYLIENAAGTLLGFSRLIVVDADGGNLQSLTRSASSRALGIRQYGGGIIAYEVEGEPDKILMQRSIVPESDLGTRTAQTEGGLAVELVDIDNLHSRRVEQPERNVFGYIADDSGAVRIQMIRQPTTVGREGDEELYRYRTADSDEWRDLGRAEVGLQMRTGFRPVAVDAQSNVVYGFDNTDGYQALYSIALDGSLERKLLLSRPDVDVDGLIRLGRRGRVVGASYATEKRFVEYTDPQLKRLAAGLAAALPGKPLIDFVGASANEGKLLIVASSDVDPGMTYLYDKATGQLAELLPVRAQLVGRAMGEMKPVTYKAADGTSIPGYLTLPPGKASPTGLPAIVLPHGGPTARDEWGFDWLVQFFTSRGYAVLQPNFRGSSGYGSDWFGRNGFQAWRTAVGDVNDAARWLVAQGVDAERLAAVGWSYGGYAALQSQVLDPDLFKAVVAIAPVTHLEKLRDEHREFTSYSWVDRFIGRGEHVKAGSPAENVARFKAPVMLVHGTIDQNVAVEQSRLMRDALEDAGKPVEYLEFENLDHSLGDSAARTKMLTEIGAFLTEKLGD